MTMGEAEEYVRSFGIDSMGETYLQAAKILHSHRREVHGLGYRGWEPVEEPILHSNHITALACSTAILRNAGMSFDVLTGSDRLVHTLRGEFRRALSRCGHNGGGARVVVIGGDSTGFRDLEKEFPRAIRVREAVPRTPDTVIKHFMINESNMCREEAPHAPLTDTSPIDAVRANLFANNRSITHCLRIKMDAIWEHLTGEKKPEPPRRRWWPFGGKK